MIRPDWNCWYSVGMKWKLSLACWCYCSEVELIVLLSSIYIDIIHVNHEIETQIVTLTLQLRILYTPFSLFWGGGQTCYEGNLSFPYGLLIKFGSGCHLSDITGRISTDATRCLERPISCRNNCSSLHIEQKNAFIQNINKHMYNLEKLPPVALLRLLPLKCCFKNWRIRTAFGCTRCRQNGAYSIQVQIMYSDVH